MDLKTTEDSDPPFNGIRISSMKLNKKNDRVSKVSTSYDTGNLASTGGNSSLTEEKVDYDDIEIYDLHTKEEL